MENKWTNRCTKHNWMEANNVKSKTGMSAASAVAERIRKQISHLNGLLSASDPYHQTVHRVESLDGSMLQQVRIAKNKMYYMKYNLDTAITSSHIKPQSRRKLKLLLEELFGMEQLVKLLREY